MVVLTAEPNRTTSKIYIDDSSAVRVETRNWNLTDVHFYYRKNTKLEKWREKYLIN